jgi:hypothetical protein
MGEIKTAEALMEDRRREELVKVASDCIELMNVGVDGDVALAKLAADNMMNDHEVELVAHAVNNSKQLAHLQTSKPEDREKPFPLINVDSVKDIKSQPLQPETNADVNTGDRYGSQEEMGDTTADKQSAPDAVQINKKILKDAAASTYVEKGDYRLRKAAEDRVGILREAWGIQEVAGRQTTPVNPYLKLAAFDVCIDEARTRAAGARNGCLSLLNKIAGELRRIDAPPFDRIEKAAHAEGVTPQLMDIIYEAAHLDTERPDLTKVAADENFYVNEREYDIVKDCVRADTMFKEAANAKAAQGALIGKKKVAASAIGGKKEPKDQEPSLMAPVPATFDVKADLGEIGKEIAEAPAAFGGLTSERVSEAAGLEPDASAREIRDVRELISDESKSELQDMEVRSTIEELMQDEYIGGHTLPEVVEAYNAAMSVNPNFGTAELVSYVRQHLATQGAVPLDLQLRAATAHKRGEE